MDQFNFADYPNTNFNESNLDWMLEVMSRFKADLESGQFVGPPGPPGPKGDPGPAGDGLTEEVKQALLQLARKVAYIDDQGETYYQDLYDALYNVTPTELVSISAAYTQSGTVYDTDSLESLKTDLIVTATYSDSSTSVIPAVDYTLSGSLTVGTSTITVSYSGKTDTFQVTVTASSVTLVSIAAAFNQGSAVVYESDSLDTLKQYLTVTATYSDSTTAAIPSTDYTLSGTLSTGTSTITVSYRGETDTFQVTVTADPVTLVSISAAFNQGSAVIYDTDSLDSLKQYLTVTATYSDSTTATIPSTDYTLSGTLTEGTSTITVSYQNKTDTFTVTVTSLLPSGYTRLQYVTANGLQYIDTGVDETQCTHAEYEVSISSQPKVNGNHILSSTNTYFPFLKGGVSSDADWRTVIGSRLKNADGISDGSSAFSWNLNQIYHLEGYPENKIYIDNEYIFTIIPGSVTSSSNHYYLFTYGGNITNTAYRFHGNLYYAKMYNSNGNLLRDFVPCKNASNVSGLYDLITQTFYHSGSGTELTGGGVA